MPRIAFIAALLIVAAGPAAAQVQTDTDQDSYRIVMPPPSDASSVISSQGRTATVGDARIGERQTRGVPRAGFRPLDRIQSRIVSRIESRLSTRIDRNYDPDASIRPLSGITTATSADRGGRTRLTTH